MGFYGNLIYNTYGMQDLAVKPRHLDRPYWVLKDKTGIIGEEGLRNFLGLEIKTNESDSDWNDRVNLATTHIFKFHFQDEDHNSVSSDKYNEQKNLRALYGSGMLIGWVRRISNGDYLYFMSMGSRTGQFFTYPLQKSSLNGIGQLQNLTEDACSPGQANKYMLQNHITTSQIKKEAVTEEKVATNAISSIKIQKDAVITDKILNNNVTPEKLQRESLEKIREWSEVKTWTDFCNKVKWIGVPNTNKGPGGSLYFFLKITAPLPTKYKNLSNKTIEKAIAWATSDTTFFIQDFYTGKQWIIIKNTSTTDTSRVITETVDGKNIKYKISLQENVTEQIADLAIKTPKIDNNSITEEKMHSNSVNTLALIDSSVKPDKLWGQYLAKTQLWETITSWESFCSKIKYIGIKNEAYSLTSGKNNKDKDVNVGGSLYFVLKVTAELPLQYKALQNDYIQRGIAWASGENTFFILDFLRGRLWLIERDVDLNVEDITRIVTEKDINYRITLQQVNSQQIQDEAITKEKLSSGVMKLIQNQYSIYDLATFDIPLGANIILHQDGGVCLYLGKILNINESGFDNNGPFGIFKVLDLEKMKVMYIRPYNPGGAMNTTYYNYEIKYGPTILGANMGKPAVAMEGQFYYSNNSDTLYICTHVDDYGPIWKPIGKGGGT